MRLVATMLGLTLMAGPAFAEPVAKRDPIRPAVHVGSDAYAAIEGRAAREAEQQAVRNARFDAQVKRVTGSVCFGCGAPVPARPRQR